ncbi:hypothetical protein Ddye_003516 [Dipteronia dyeriana]|uniref:Cyclin A n=1 Tax=Dipteronia dyeriana TaxID=168575 RepID=A0AAD9XSZ2_9ROSI|nr:hypothetical protein Ddye_003516 [Dipteronia dyeriana]
MENSVESTLSVSKKRVSLSHSHSLELELPKRVALGELTNSSNGVELSRNVHKQQPNRSSSSSSSKRKYKEDVENSPSTESTRESESGNRECKRKLKEKKENEVAIVHESSESSSVLQKCSFSSSIYEHLRSLEMEVKRRPLPKYMEDVQNDISVIMREILVDWLVEVAEEYNLVSDTLYLTIAYVDRFLSSHALSRNKLQLLGVGCMLIASKYEEISPPHVEDFCYITDNSYTNEEVVSMETEVLNFLNFEMSTPTTKNFLRVFIKSTHENGRAADLRFEFLCCYLAELSLLDYGCVQYLPSLVAASAIFLSRFLIQPEKHPWSMALQCFSGYKPTELKDCVLAIHDLHMNRRISSLQAIREKYKQHKFKHVAALSSPSEVPARYFEAINDNGLLDFQRSFEV